MCLYSVYYDENRNKNKNGLITENMKTTMKQLTTATFLALIMLVGNVNAEGTQAKVSGCENNDETTLRVEKWMVDNNIWDADGSNVDSFSTDTDDLLYIEGWMTEIDDFNFQVIEEQETPLTTENWMTTGQDWFTGETNNTVESVLTVENWMINDNVWK